MAIATFGDILTAQRESNELLKKQRHPLDGRTGAGKALIDAQRETTATISGKLDELMGNTPDPSQVEETTKEAGSAQNERFGSLGKIFTTQIGKVTGALKGILGKTKAPLLAALTAAGLLALANFLESETWKNMRDWIVDKGIPKLLELWEKYITPVFDFLYGEFTDLWSDLLDFFEEPSFKKLGTLIGENVVALGIIAGLLAPKLLLKGLKVAVIALGSAFNALGAAAMALLAPLAIPLLVAAGIVVTLTAISRSIEALEHELHNGEGIFSAIGTALAVFFVELFKIPAEFIAKLIPEDVKDKFYMGIVLFGEGIQKAFKALSDFIDGFIDALLPEKLQEKFSVGLADVIDGTVKWISEFFESVMAPFRRAVKAYKEDGIRAAIKAFRNDPNTPLTNRELIYDRRRDIQYEQGLTFQKAKELAIAQLIEEGALEKGARGVGDIPPINQINQDNSKKSEVNSTIELSSSEDKAEEPGFWRGLAFN